MQRLSLKWLDLLILIGIFQLFKQLFLSLIDRSSVADTLNAIYLDVVEYERPFGFIYTIYTLAKQVA